MILDIQDIENSISVAALIKDEFIKRGIFARLNNGGFQSCVGGFSIVFPVAVDGSKWAFRCWHHTLDEDQARIKALSSELKKANLPYFVDFEYEDSGIVVNGAVYPTTRMKWINGRDIKDYLCYHRNNRHKVFELASNFFSMIQDLHQQSIAHGDLQHENIIVTSAGKIYLIDYDSMYLPAFSFFHSRNTTNGKEGYQHPARENCVYSNPKLDYFSEVIILTSILAIAYKPELAEKYNLVDADTMLFRKVDFRDFSNSRIYLDLSSLGGVFPLLLSVISDYLKKQDILSLEPLEDVIQKFGAHGISNFSVFLKEAEENIIKKEEENKRQQELIAWRTAYRNNTYKGYQSYLFEYPLGIHASEARVKASECKRAEAALQESADWGKTLSANTKSKYESFIRSYPFSVHVDEAKRRIADIEEDTIWLSSSHTNTIDSYEFYLSKYPEGRYVSIARQRIAELKPSFPMAFVIIIIAVLIVFCLGIYASYQDEHHGFDGGNIDIEQVNTKIDKKETPSTSVPKSQPKTQSKISDSELTNLENSTDRLIKGMELAIKLGDTRDEKTYRQVGKNLDELKKNGSNKYNSLKIRYDAL